MQIHRTLQQRRLPIGAAALAVFLFSSFGALEMREAAAFDGEVILAQARPAASTETRLKALETKTDYYQKKYKKIQKTYQIRKKSSAVAGLSCQDGRLHFTLDPQFQFGGTSYTWLTLTINHQIRENLYFQFNNAMEGGRGCVKIAPANSSGTATVKGFCSFDIERGSKFRVEVSAIVVENYVNACDLISELNAELKLTNVEVIEPQ